MNAGKYLWQIALTCCHKPTAFIAFVSSNQKQSLRTITANLRMFGCGKVEVSSCQLSTMCVLISFPFLYLFSFQICMDDAAGPGPAKRRRGGLRQRLVATERGEEPENRQSFLADSLLEKWSWGQLSPQDVQLLASMACRDMAHLGTRPPPDLSFLASLGTDGKHKNNMHKQLLQWGNQKCADMAKPYMCRLVFKEPYNSQLQALLLPHEMFSCLYHDYHKSFKQVMLPSDDLLTSFWSLQKKHPACSTVADIPGFKKQMVPLAFHGDGTPVVGVGKIWSRQLTILSFNSLLGSGSTKDMQLPIFNYFDETMGQETLDQVWEVLAWSLTWLRKGLWPDRNHKGKLQLGSENHVCLSVLVSFHAFQLQNYMNPMFVVLLPIDRYDPASKEGRKAQQPLAGGYAATVWALVGDLEYLNAVLKLPHYASKTSPCALCKCTGGAESTSWKDCRPTAEWVGLQWTPSE